jgi:hypothetical protein
LKGSASGVAFFAVFMAKKSRLGQQNLRHPATEFEAGSAPSPIAARAAPC